MLYLLPALVRLVVSAPALGRRLWVQIVLCSFFATWSCPRICLMRHNLCKACTCLLCSKSSVDPSPLTHAHENDAWSGRRPWGKYRKVTDQGVRVPEGRICLLCFNVFRSLGYQYSHGTYSEYWKKNKDKPQEHGVFLSALAEWIKSHNASPDSRLGNKELKSKTQLATQNKTGIKFKKPKKVFVLEKIGTPKCTGPWTPTKLWMSKPSARQSVGCG